MNDLQPEINQNKTILTQQPEINTSLARIMKILRRLGLIISLLFSLYIVRLEVIVLVGFISNNLGIVFFIVALEKYVKVFSVLAAISLIINAFNFRIGRFARLRIIEKYLVIFNVIIAISWLIPAGLLWKSEQEYQKQQAIKQGVTLGEYKTSVKRTEQALVLLDEARRSGDSKICAEHQNLFVEKEINCFLEVAVESGNADICRTALGANPLQRDSCLQLVAKRKNDAGLCEDITTAYYRRRCMEKLTTGPTPKTVEKCREEKEVFNWNGEQFLGCVMRVAAEAGDATICKEYEENFRELKKAKQCGTPGIPIDDPFRFCDMGCYERVAVKTKDGQVCLQLSTDHPERDSCFQAAATLSLDTKLCDEITSNSYRTFCVENVERIISNQAK